MMRIKFPMLLSNQAATKAAVKAVKKAAAIAAT